MMTRFRPARALLLLSLILLAPLTPAQPEVPARRDAETVPSVPLGQRAGEEFPGFDQGPFSPSDADTFNMLLERQAGDTTPTAPLQPGQVPMIEPINDPLEPMNRAIFGFNVQAVRWVIGPLEEVYMLVAPKPVRRSIRRAGHNLEYPVRLINTLLQGKGKGAATETGRFLINSTVGLLGFFDPATRLGLDRYNEDFGQTFGHWGFGPGFFLMLPLVGASSGRDALGSLGDRAADPATYIPGASLAFNFNDFSFIMPVLERIVNIEQDPYVLIRDVYALERRREVIDFEIETTRPADPSPSLQSVFLRVQDEKFEDRAKEREASIPATGRKLPYTVWLQREEAPLLYILPGIGSHRRSESAVALAEQAFGRGFSVVIVSSAMNWEFMERAATVSVPGYPPADVRDVQAALTQIDRDLTRRYPGRFSRRALLGLSLGGLHALHIAAQEGRAPAGSLRFDRYVVIDAPVDLLYAAQQLDRFYNAPLEWASAERDQRINETLLKASALIQRNPEPDQMLPFTRTESRYLIGLAFRLTLRDVIYVSQKRENLGVLKSEIRRFRRERVYDEIGRYGYMDYLRQFVIPYFQRQQRGVASSPGAMFGDASLHSIENELQVNPKVRVFANESDFLLQDEDQRWLASTFGERLTIFRRGGHTGALHRSSVQEEIMNSLGDLVRTN